MGTTTDFIINYEAFAYLGGRFLLFFAVLWGIGWSIKIMRNS